jgi:asparagine synthase (glutamine-hydrolysing)
MSDVPLGLFLSGGIDSSALAGIAAEMIDGPLQTFSVGFEEAEANELPYARRVAQRLGAEHREVIVSPAEYFAALPGLIWQEDEPIAFTSSVPLFFVSRLARDHVKVVLTGEGSDELFLGYNRYRVTHWNARLGRPYWAITPHRVRSGVRQLVRQLPDPLRRYATRTFFSLDPGQRSLFYENFSVFPESMRRDLLASVGQRGDRDPYAVALDCYQDASGTALDRMSRADLQTYLHELLMKQDQMSMAASLESRVPFLDDDVVEHVATMPAHFKLHGWHTKAILRAAVRDFVPAEILARKKMGFPVPIGRWLRGSFQPIVNEFVLGDRARARGLFDGQALRRLAEEHQSGRAEHGDRLWLLANLEIWHRVFVEGENPAEMMGPVRKAIGMPYARAMGEDGRSLAAKYRRPPAQLPHALRTGAATSSRAGDNPWTGR